MKWYYFLASAESDLLRSPGSGLQKTSQLVFTDLLLIIGAGIIVTALLILGALYAHKQRRHRRHRHKHHHHHTPVQAKVMDIEPDENPEEIASSAEDSEKTSGHHRHHRRRIRRRDHRGRNPTLAETGGLPPLRPPPSSASVPPSEQF